MKIYSLNNETGKEVKSVHDALGVEIQYVQEYNVDTEEVVSFVLTKIDDNKRCVMYWDDEQKEFRLVVAKYRVPGSFVKLRDGTIIGRMWNTDGTPKDNFKKLL